MFSPEGKPISPDIRSQHGAAMTDKVAAKREELDADQECGRPAIGLKSKVPKYRL